MIKTTQSLTRVLSAAALLAPVTPIHAAAFAESAEFSAVYTGELWRNDRGGLKAGNAYLDNLDLTLDVDAEKWLGWQGGRWFAYVLYNNGATISATHVGDAQVISNIETVRALRLYEFWYEQTLDDKAASLRVGLYDLNAEFYATDSSRLFINASHGIGPDFSQSGEMGPSIFSVTSLALRWQQNLNDQFSWRVAVLDAVPGDPDHPERTVVELRGDEGALAVGEVDFHPDNYRLGVGSWRYSRRQPRLDDSGTATSWGSYGYAEMSLDGASLEAARVRAFLRGGVAADAANRFADFIGGGIVLDGGLWGRADDAVGISFARAHDGAPYRDVVAAAGAGSSSQELDVELTYRFCVNERLAVQPDVQYIVHPDTNPDLDNALAFGLRVQLTLY